MFNILVSYSDYLDFDLLQTLDELFLSLNLSKQPLEQLVTQLKDFKLMLLFLPFCVVASKSILNFVIQLKNKPQFIVCFSSKFNKDLEVICRENSFYYIYPKIYSDKLMSILTFIKTQLSAHLLMFKDLSLNTQTRECRRLDSKITLTNQEFHLLEYLLQNIDRPVSKAELLEHVWGLKSTVATRSVDVYISRIRAKIDSQFDSKYIKTIHCFGYVIS